MVAVVTGASRGLGAGMAEVFAAEGMRLGLCARTVPAVPEGALAVSVSVDVSEAGALDRFAGQVIDAFGRIDLWINNAGVLAPIGPLVHADPDEVSGNIGINLVGTANGTAAFGRHVRSRPGGGLLVNISSGAANRAYEGWAAYCASKAGVEMLTEVVSLEEQKSGLRAYALAPGVVDTDMQAMVRSTPDDRFPAGERFRRLHNEGRLGTPGWVARYVLDELLAPGDRQGDQPKGVRRRVPDQ
jgi:NAD(P)-dependent dehydrogenase (short-subunit alcohol dehydrogenase family)